MPIGDEFLPAGHPRLITVRDLDAHPVEVLLCVKQARMHEWMSIVSQRFRRGAGEEERRKHAAS